MAIAIVKRHGVYWMDNGWFPFNIGFVASKKGWEKAMKYLEVRGDEPYPDNAGRCTKMLSRDGDLCVLITINDWQDKEYSRVAGLAAHESVHAFDFLCEHIGEMNPSSEFAAYTTQAFVQMTLDAIDIERNKKKKTR